jgi:phospholipid/cholesterol/gamma-HCH transport system substrate-binding protein
VSSGVFVPLHSTITEEINDGKGTVGLLLNDAEVARDLKNHVLLKNIRKRNSKNNENLNKLVESMNNKDNVIGFLKDTACQKHKKQLLVI